MKKIIKNGTIVTATDTYKADIEINDGVITQIGSGFYSQEAEVIDAEGCYVFPGGIDPHTHLDMPFGGTMTKDDYETGTRAAAFGAASSCSLSVDVTTRERTAKHEGIRPVPYLLTVFSPLVSPQLIVSATKKQNG